MSGHILQKKAPLYPSLLHVVFEYMSPPSSLANIVVSAVKSLGEEICKEIQPPVNPLSPKSDQHQISPCNVNAL